MPAMLFLIALLFLRIPDPVFIAHALGGIQGNTYTNSKEAFEYNYQRGFRWFEVDLTLTKDKRLICFHTNHEKHLGLDEPISFFNLKEALSFQYKGKYPLMAFSELLSLVSQRKDVYIITDTKEINRSILFALYQEVNKVDPALKDKIIVQFYHLDEIPLLQSYEKRKGPWASLIWTLYNTRFNPYKVYQGVIKYSLPIITIHKDRFFKQFADTLHLLGSKVFVHTLNDSEEISQFLDQGVNGIYTDRYLSP